MKQKLALIFCLTTTMLFGSRSFAQDKDSIKTLPPVTVTPTSNVETAVLNSFDKDFKDAVHPRWYTVDKDYLVKFIKGDMNNNALYKKNGKMVYHISYGHENNLPADIKSMVENSYPEYKISNAIAVKASGRDLWLINLEGMKKWVMVQVENGELQEVKSFDKA